MTSDLTSPWLHPILTNQIQVQALNSHINNSEFCSLCSIAPVKSIAPKTSKVNELELELV